MNKPGDRIAMNLTIYLPTWICALTLAAGVATAEMDEAALDEAGQAAAADLFVAVEPADQPLAVAAAPAPAAQAVDEEADTIIIDYNDADIQNVLRTLAARAGINLILSDEVTGRVTVHLEGVSYADALQLIAESKGYAYIQSRNVVQVKTKESVEAEPLEVRVRTLNYAKAEEVKAVLDPVLTSRGRMQVDVRSNTLIVSDTPSNLVKVMPLIEVLDTQTPQVMIEARFVETSRNPRKDLGINWSDTLLEHPLTASGMSAVPGAGAGFSLAKDLGGGPWTPATALLNAGQARVLLSFLNQDTETELLANPRVVTTDNGKARISIATQFPIPSFSFSEQTASFQITGFEYKDIGIILDVTPRINKDQFVTLEVSPEASSSSENATLTSGEGNAVQIPIINTRTATTTVLIKSGHTLAIGGLMRKEISDKYTKVPIMGDFPLLGAFFRSKSLEISKRDLLIFLTPTIVGPESKTGYEAFFDGLPAEEVFTRDKWMPGDGAKPRDLLQRRPPQPEQPPTENRPRSQNFAPKP
jgi:type IV pilus assembly protein PilQ